MHRKCSLSACLLICLALPLLGACGKSAATRFYSLAAESQEPAQTQVPTGKGSCPSLGVGPVELPPYLDRTQMVTRGEGTRMHLSEFDQWIEPVQANFTRALADALSGKVCANPLLEHPWPGGMHPDRQVAVQIRQFDGTLGGQAVLRADWTIVDQDGRVLAWKSTTLREPSSGPDHAALVAAQRRLVDRLAQAMAEALAGS